MEVLIAPLSLCHVQDGYETALLTVPVVEQVVCFSEPQGEAAQASSDNDQTPDKNKKKNRCFSCRKKVGLTGKKGTFSRCTLLSEGLNV